jgi:zinc transport system substrate-binding protein
MKKLLLLIALILTTACGEKSESPEPKAVAESPVLITSNYPLYYFAAQIAGDEAEVYFPSMEGDPAQWVPAGEDMVRLQQADLLIINGATYESWLAFVTLPDGLLLDTSAHLSDQMLAVEKETVHQHGPEGEHSHPGIAFTTWLDPTFAMEQAGAIEQRLSELMPENADLFGPRLDELKRQLGALDQSLAQVLEPLQGRPILFSHPVYQYLASRYLLDGHSLHWEPDVEPGTRDWIELSRIQQEHPAELMIWEAQPSQQTIDLLRERGIQAVVFEPAGNRPEEGDYLQVMEQNVERLRAAVQ